MNATDDKTYDDIFLSYQSKDRAKALRVAEALENLGWSVFRDRKTPIGTSWGAFIEKKLEKAKCVVVLWSASAVRSKWVNIEAADADERGILVPAMIENVRPPLQFRQLQAANLVDWNGDPGGEEFDQLVRAVARLASYPAESGRELTQDRERNRRDLIAGLEERGFRKSPRSDRVYYDETGDVRFRFRDTVVRLERRRDSKWTREASFQLTSEIHLALKAIE